MPSENFLTTAMIICGVIAVILFIVLIIVYINSKMKENKPKKVVNSEETTGKEPKAKTFAVRSVMDFMEFDKVEDNMIIQKNGRKYVIVVECQGINYDLMSEIEKNSVEEGFIQFLNTLRHPIQIYVQTRTINLESSIQTYNERVEEIEAK